MGPDGETSSPSEDGALRRGPGRGDEEQDGVAAVSPSSTSASVMHTPLTSTSTSPKLKEARLSQSNSTTAPASPKFQVANSLTSARSSIGANAMSGSSAVRRAGGWRGSWAAPRTPKSSAGGSNNGDAVDSPPLTGDQAHGSTSSATTLSAALTSAEGEAAAEGATLWDQVRVPPMMSPPEGSVMELPGSGMATSPVAETSSSAAQALLGKSNAVQPSSADSHALPSTSLSSTAPWERDPARAGNYDWANFVYAYARGRWNPVQLPHPPGRSNAIPGASTVISSEEVLQPPSDPSSPSGSIRRPSLTYPDIDEADIDGKLSAAAASIVSPRTMPAALAAQSKTTTTTTTTTPPPPQQTISSAILFGDAIETSAEAPPSPRERMASVPVPAKDKLADRKAIAGPSHPTAATGGQPSLSSSKTMFTDPFNVIQLVTSSAPEIGMAATLGDTAQKLMNDNRASTSPSSVAASSSLGIGGGRSSSQVETLSRTSSERRPKPKTDDSVWFPSSVREGERSSPSTSRPSQSSSSGPSSSIAAPRPTFITQVSDLNLGAGYRTVGPGPAVFSSASPSTMANSASLPSIAPSKSGGSQTTQRPLPTPVQEPGLLEDNKDDIPKHAWTSAPEGISLLRRSQSGTNLGPVEVVHAGPSSGKGRIHEEAGITVSGPLRSLSGEDFASSSLDVLRRAARRRSSLRRSQDSHGNVAVTSHSNSYPSASMMGLQQENSGGSICVPSLGGQMAEEQYHEPSSTVTATRNRSDPNIEPPTAALPVPSGNTRSRTNSELVAAGAGPTLASKPPQRLGAIGQTNSSPSLSNYLNVGKRVELFYKKHGYLPAILPPDEADRRQALRRYGPPKLKGDVNFDRIAHLVKLVFNTKVVLISLVNEKTQFFQTEVGSMSSDFTTPDWLQRVAQSRDCSLCSHAILQTTDEPLVILDAERDWRFAGNPLVTGPPHIRFYAGSPLRTSDGFNLGSLCIIDDRPWTEFNPRQRHTLKEFARVVMREMELIRDTIQLRLRDGMQHSIETFTRECLELEQSDGGSDKDQQPQQQQQQGGEDGNGLHQVYAFAAKGMREALRASGAIVFDLSHFELVVSSPQEDDGGSKIFFPSPYQNPDVTPFVSFDNPVTLDSLRSPDAMGDGAVDGKLGQKTVPAMAVLGASETCTPPAGRDQPVPLAHYIRVAEFLRRHRTGCYYPFAPAPFRHLLPPGMSNVLLVPIFGLNKQPFALLCAYSKPSEGGPTLEDIKDSGLQYLRAMGTIILSAILKKDIMLADKAKSHFISNISHELRTPLHGILAAAELLAETKLNSTQGSYLETVEACGKSLLELVNHVLDFTKLSGNMHSSQQAASKPSQWCDLVRLVQEVCESSFIGQMARKLESQQSSGIGSAYAKGSDSVASSRSSSSPSSTSLSNNSKALMHDVETVIDVSMRKDGWLVRCDAGGIRRVLMNLIGNSLKFTSHGFVHVSLREVQSTETHVVVELGVTDTGKGISRTFLEEQLFHPFTQENHLGPGTGLGLSIVNSIVQSPAINGKIDVWSTLGQGTEIRVTCELELCKPEDIEGTTYQPALNVEGQRSITMLGFKSDSRGDSDLKEVLNSYYVDWWRFLLEDGANEDEDDVEEGVGAAGDLVLINDDVTLLPKIIQARRAKNSAALLPPAIVLTGARGDAEVTAACDAYQKAGGVARLLFKPAGPAKLEAVTDFCLQCFERARAGEPFLTEETMHSTPLPSPRYGWEPEREGSSSSRPASYFGGRMRDNGRQGDSDDEDEDVENYAPGVDATPTAITPKATVNWADQPHSRSASARRPHLADLRRTSHHISPGPPDGQHMASLIRRHSSEDRRLQKGGSPVSVDTTPRPDTVGPSSTTKHTRPLLPTRSITYHEPRLQRHVLMSPLRSPHSSRVLPDYEPQDYFGAHHYHQQQLGASSGPGQTSSVPGTPGSTVSLDGAEGAVLKTALPSHKTPPVLTKHRLQILFVEDNDINRRLMAAYLSKMDVDFVEATNGLEGVEIFEQSPSRHFDVIFMDLSMPVLDGMAATARIRKIEAERFRAEVRANGGRAPLVATPGGSRPAAQVRTKILTLTGRSTDEDRRQAFAMGADGYLVKPLSFKSMTSLLKKLTKGD